MGSVTIKDIARICKVSVSTVSRAINDEPTIRKKTKEKVMAAVREYNYVPNASARSLKITSFNTIGVIVSDLTNPFFYSVVRLYEVELKKKNYSFELYAVSEDENEIEAAIRLIRERKVRGIIFLGGHFINKREALKELTVPYVMCTVAYQKNEPGFGCTSVAIDDENESYKAVKYLIENGHRRIAMIAGRKNDTAIGTSRLEGYRRALKEFDIEYDEDLVWYMKDDIPEFTADNGYEVAKELLLSGREFTAIFAISDMVAMGVLRAASEVGKKIPDDYSVMGFDGVDMGKYMVPSLTTIQQPINEMGKASVYALIKEIESIDEKVKCSSDETSSEKKSDSPDDTSIEKVQMIYDGKLIERESVRNIT